tara:strand:- start:491 stop:811 length:321 start_codon:yes stop_codon:yes gene_type:complete
LGVSKAEETLAFQIRAVKLPEPVREHRFHETRKWRFDFAYPSQKLAIEVEGGVWSGGRHTRGSGFTNDCEKYNAALMNGWRVYRCTPDMIKKGIVVADLSILLGKL